MASLRQLTAGLEHEDPIIRAKSACELGRYRRAAACAVRRLVDLVVGDPDSGVRGQAIVALIEIARDGVGTPEAYLRTEAQTGSFPGSAHAAHALERLEAAVSE